MLEDAVQGIRGRPFESLAELLGQQARSGLHLLELEADLLDVFQRRGIAELGGHLLHLRQQALDNGAFLAIQIDQSPLCLGLADQAGLALDLDLLLATADDALSQAVLLLQLLQIGFGLGEADQVVYLCGAGAIALGEGLGA